jgi:signal transduction histidine kinase
VAVAGIGAVASIATPTPFGATAVGLALSATAAAAATAPTTAGLVAWLACATSVVGGIGVDLPTYLLVGVPLWAMARYSPAPRVALGSLAALLGGALAGGYAIAADLQIYVLTPSPRLRGWTLTPDTWLQATALACVVWLVALLFLAAGLLSRWREAARAARQADQAGRARAAALAAERALAEERASISREMHDIVAHSLSVMIAQADGGRYAAAANPAAALGALDAIAKTGRDALSDLRGIVRVLREGPEDRDMDLRPAPHVRDLRALVDETRAAGLDVTLVQVGQTRYLPPGVGAALQRIAQEALTNALKHAGPQVEVVVTERWLADRIQLVVSDDGRGAAAASDGEGHGLLGMRERAEMLGGALRAGPGPTGGFKVIAEVPLPAARQTGDGA